jgi:hypothetical protein
MSKPAMTVFLCGGKDCAKAWKRVCRNSPAKWLKRRADEAGLPFKLNVVDTECMDRCDDAATCWFVHGGAAMCVDCVHGDSDAGRILAALRDCAERAAASDPCICMQPKTDRGS